LFSCRILIFFLFAISIHGQHKLLRFDHLTVEDGLSQGAVYAILEDYRGFMWFGTRFGLNRYDGHNFRHFNHDPKDSTSIPGYRILALFEDKSRTMWVGTEDGGLARYNRETESFKNFIHDPEDSKSLSSDLTTCIFEDSKQNLWIGTQDGLNRYDREREQFNRYYHTEGDTNSLPSSWITAISEISPGILLVGFGNGSLASMNLRAEEISEIKNDEFWPSKTSIRAINCIVKDKKNDYVWVARFTYGLTKFSYKNGILNHYEPQDWANQGSINFIYSISQDHTGKLWLATIGGLTVFDPATEVFSFNRYDDTQPTGISDNIIFSTHIDKQGLVWAGSDAKGINICKPNQIRFELFSHKSDNPQGPSSNGVYAFTEDKEGDIWFAAIPGGTNRYDPDTGTFRYYQSNDSIHGAWSMNYAMQVMIDQLDMVWIGTATAGLSIVDPQSGKRLKIYRNNSSKPHSLSGHTVYSLLENSAGTIWVGTKENGLSRFNRDKNDFTIFKYDPNDSTSIGGDCIYALLEDNKKVLWVGTSQGGLSRYHPDSETFTTFKYSTGNDNSLQSNWVLALYEDSRNNLWIGTHGGGLNKLDPSRTQFSTLNLGVENTGISIYSIEEDYHGHLWLSTNNGLIKADPESGFLNRYTKDDGLQGNEFLYGSSLEDSEGNFYFGGPNGFNRFHPDSVLNNPHIPPVVITNFKINYEEVPIGEMADGRTVLAKSITETKNIELIHGDKTVSFSYSALDFSDPERNRFMYKLENFNDDWIPDGSNHVATYTSLEQGDYTFRVKASNNDGLWNETGASIDITVLPPFWKTWWFNIQLSLTLILIIFIYIRLRFRRIEAEKRKLEKLVIERTAELQLEIEERQRVETEKMQLKVDHLKRELVSKSIHATEKQEIMNNLFEELKNIQKMDANEMRNRFNGIVRYFREMFKLGQDWDEFEMWFTEVHTDFFANLRQKHPELSQREIKVCALLRLNLLSKDIANLMNIQPKTVEIYRHRIRKKVGLQPDNNLNLFFSQF